MILQGKLFAESPIYRGNARKTLFTRDGDGTQKLVSLAGEIEGTAQSLMDAFIGSSRNGRNIGLLNELWSRLYGSRMPEKLITQAICKLRQESYPRDHFFDLRMGIRLDEDRWAAEANANYKMETLFRNSVFDLTIHVNDSVLQHGENEARLFHLFEELKSGRFWFGAGKSKGLGRCRLEMDLPFSGAKLQDPVHTKTNHLTISLTFDAVNPVLVGWNWGKVDPDVPAFAAVEGRLLLEAMRNLPTPVRQRLEMTIGGPILSSEDWKRKLAEFLPRTIAIWLKEGPASETESWSLPSSALSKLTRGKYPLSKKLVAQIQPLMDQPFPSKDALRTAIRDAFGKKANMAKRVLEHAESQTQTVQQLNQEAWEQIVNSLRLDPSLADPLTSHIEDENAMVEILAEGCEKVLPGLYQQVDRQIRLLQSDTWIDSEIAEREEHIRIKSMLLDGHITEQQWGDPTRIPEGVSATTWRGFLDAHRRVSYRHIVSPRNLRKSITNDRNFVAFLEAYRARTRQELTQTYNTDFRAGGSSNREISREYGKPYDTVFMRMLSWAPSAEGQGSWEIYIPGSTIKGAFRKRASQVLKTFWGDSAKTDGLLNRLFGAQGRRGLVFFSDAYLVDPTDPESSWCSMDGVRMDPTTGQPIENAKADYLFAYGEQLAFHLRLDLQDVNERDQEAISLLSHLIHDFQRGDIPIGGEKTSGFGWVQADVTGLEWRTTDPDDFGRQLFAEHRLTKSDLWHTLELDDEAATTALLSIAPLAPQAVVNSQTPPRADAGFISHRAFGGYSGFLVVEGTVLTPLSVSESGEPSFRTIIEGEPVNGWDFFSMSPPTAAQRGSRRSYALPSKSIKGMIRHIYSIASDSRDSSTDISQLNPTDGLFGWVGNGPNQALMGRLSFSFGMFEEPELAWFKLPYPYGQWQWNGTEWKQDPDSTAAMFRVGKHWRVFPHAPLPPIVQKLDAFAPDVRQASYMRAILPGARCRFTIRFWNLEEEELQRLIWCVALEEGLAHKMGKGRYLGLGSLQLRILPESFLIDWAGRYSGKPEQAWRLPLKIDEWFHSEAVQHHAALRKVLDAKHL